MSGWDFDNDSSGKKQEFTKFPEGIVKIRLVDDAPVVRWTHWMPSSMLKGVTGKGRSVNCPGRDCPICEIRRQQKANKEPYTIGMSRRLAMQILNKNTGKLEIMEQGITFYEDLRDVREVLNNKGENVYDYDLSVRRRGTGQSDTSYRIDPDEKTPLTPEEEQLIKEAIDLKEYFKPHEPDKILRVLNGEEFDEVMYNNNETEEEVILE